MNPEESPASPPPAENLLNHASGRLLDAMLRAEVIGIDPVWQRIVLPSTAVLRAGLLAAVLFPGAFQAHVAPEVRLAAACLAGGHLLLYGAVWAGLVAPAAVALASLLDAVLAGLLIAGAGPLAALAGFGGLLVLAVAHMCGGTRLALASGVLLAAGWLGGVAAEVPALMWLGHWSAADFRLALETETSYRGGVLAAASEWQVARAALGTFLLISLAGCLAFVRAQRERTRVLRACARVDALEGIVDARSEALSEEEFWRTVSRCASQFTGQRVLAAWAEEGALRLAEGAVAAGDGLGGLCVPLEARGNLILHAIDVGREVETGSAGDLTAGALEAPAQARSPRRTRYVVAPVQGETAALLAVTRADTGDVLEALRVVGERVARVRRVWPRGAEPLELEPAGA